MLTQALLRPTRAPEGADSLAADAAPSAPHPDPAPDHTARPLAPCTRGPAAECGSLALEELGREDTAALAARGLWWAWGLLVLPDATETPGAPLQRSKQGRGATAPKSFTSSSLRVDGAEEGGGRLVLP